MLREEKAKYGPYSSGNDPGRMFYIVKYADGTKRSVTRARYMMEHHLGRHLERWEFVDHINNDKTDDRLENFQILTPRENNVKSMKPAEMHRYNCAWCGKETMKFARQVRHNQNVLKKAGPFCGKSCAGKYSTSVQHYGAPRLAAVGL